MKPHRVRQDDFHLLRETAAAGWSGRGSRRAGFERPTPLFVRALRSVDLPHVGVADDGQDGQGVPFPERPPLAAPPLEMAQLLLQPGDALPDAAAVDLQLHLSRAARSDAARQPGHRPVPRRQARQHVTGAGASST